MLVSATLAPLTSKRTIVKSLDSRTSVETFEEARRPSHPQPMSRLRELRVGLDRKSYRLSSGLPWTIQCTEKRFDTLHLVAKLDQMCNCGPRTTRSNKEEMPTRQMPRQAPRCVDNQGA